MYLLKKLGHLSYRGPTVWIVLIVSLLQVHFWFVCWLWTLSFILESFLRYQVVLLCLLYLKIRDGGNQPNSSLAQVSGSLLAIASLKRVVYSPLLGEPPVSVTLAVSDCPASSCLLPEGLSISAIFLGTKVGVGLVVNISLACVHRIPAFMTVPTPQQVVLSPSPRDLYFILPRECIFMYILLPDGGGAIIALQNRGLVWGISLSLEDPLYSSSSLPVFPISSNALRAFWEFCGEN